MKRIILFICAVLAVSGPTGLYAQAGDGRPLIQLALLLDTSNSMDGLINQAKSQLWKIVSETGRIRRRGLRPVLQVALYEYGNDNLSITSGFIRQVSSFTTDLDYLSYQLFSLATYGGSEYCGKVIDRAAKDLDWDRNADTLKLIFIAGNEPFTQGPVNYVKSGRAAYQKGIIVNTIFCGSYGEGVMTNWEHGAQIAGGRYINIDSDYEQTYIQAPQDERIEQLNRRLNATYLGYGVLGGERKKLQEEQDANAYNLNRESSIARAQVKSSSSYSNSSWDLVDAYTEGGVAINELNEEDLPIEMRDMTDSEKEDYIQRMVLERASIQEEIRKLSEEREEYISGIMREPTEDVSTLDSAMLEALLAAARAKGFDLE